MAIRVRQQDLQERAGVRQGITPVTAVFPVAGSCKDGFLFYAEGRSYRVVRADINYAVKGGSGATLNLRTVATGSAPSSGTLVKAFDLTQDANNVYSHTTASQIPSGQMLAVDFEGTLTGLEGLGLCVLLAPE